MSIEDLMFPRYKVVGDFWDNPFEMGTILTFNNLKEPFMPPLEELESGNITKYLFTDFLKCKGGSTMYCIKRFEGYPHLFQKLEWWEERAIEEMPKYLKIIIAKNESDEGHVFKVDRYEEYYVNDADIPHDSYLAFSETIIDCMPMIFCNPATEEEYNTYINQQK